MCIISHVDSQKAHMPHFHKLLQPWLCRTLIPHFTSVSWFHFIPKYLFEKFWLKTEQCLAFGCRGGFTASQFGQCWVWKIFLFFLGGKKWGSFQLKASASPLPPAEWSALPGTSGLLSPWLRKALVTYRNSCWYYFISRGNHKHISVLIKCPGTSTHWGDTSVTVCWCWWVTTVSVRRWSERPFPKALGVETWPVPKLQCLSCSLTWNNYAFLYHFRAILERWWLIRLSAGWSLWPSFLLKGRGPEQGRISEWGRLFTTSCSDRTRDNGFKLTQRRFGLDI